jgi:hypothetical protein
MSAARTPRPTRAPAVKFNELSSSMPAGEIRDDCKAIVAAPMRVAALGFDVGMTRFLIPE